MKRILLLALLMVGIIAISTAKEVKPEFARQVAINFYKQVAGDKDNSGFKLVYTCRYSFKKGSDSKDQKDVPLYYVFGSTNNKGFVIVAGDDNAIPIFGYSTNSSYDNSNLPSNFRKWLEGYKNQMRHIIDHEITANEDIHALWENIKNGTISMAGNGTKAVNPLLTTTWDQSPYVNDLCPYDYTYNERTVTGCPATAMAQIMKYWEYPVNGIGFHSYNHPAYGTLSANFASTTYEWGSMPNVVNSTNYAVATLMYHCGVGVEMQYGVASTGGSGSYVIIDASPTPEQCCEYAFTTYFGYDAGTIQGLRRANYSDSQWKNMIKTELDEGRPVQYAGYGAGGHTFVCDGYDNNYFHMNWGWGGYADGYFLLDALNPGGGGTGSGAGTYNDYQQAIIGIQPPSGTTSYDLTLYDNVTATPNPVYYTQGFTVHTDIANWGTATFYGDYCAAIFDQNYTFVDYVEILSGYSLGGGYHYTDGLDFTNSGMVTLLPGSYYIGIYYRPTGEDWIIVDDGSYANIISFEVYYSNDIELYQEMVISCGTNITRNQAFHVTLDIANDGNTTFTGDFNVSLYYLDGDYASSVQTLTGASLDPGYYYDDLVFESNGLDLSPGSYLMAVLHLPDGGSWELTGSTYYTNPIFVNIVEDNMDPDMYENNNAQNNAYNLNVSFSGNNSNVNTNGSNLHLGSDEDYYKIVLVSGFDYTISARAHDSYNSGNGNTYTCDVSWLYDDGSGWSSSYDDIMSSNIIVSNGGTVYFRVAPYFAGETGTYLIDINITRSSTGVEEVENSGFISVYPNPANEYLFIDVKEQVNIKGIEILDVLGKCVFWKEDVGYIDQLKVHTEGLRAGSYLMVIESADYKWQKKFVKTE